MSKIKKTVEKMVFRIIVVHPSNGNGNCRTISRYELTSGTTRITAPDLNLDALEVLFSNFGQVAFTEVSVENSIVLGGAGHDVPCAEAAVAETHV